VEAGELTLVTVCVGRGEAVAVSSSGVPAVDVSEGVRIACNVNAAAVWTSSGGGNCSNGMLQPRRAKSRTIPARDGILDFIELFIGLCRSKVYATDCITPQLLKSKDSQPVHGVGVFIRVLKRAYSVSKSSVTGSLKLPLPRFPFTSDVLIAYCKTAYAIASELTSSA
jgi:hypothetical protein